MGGGVDQHHGGAHGAEDFRTKVWSMTGGPYCRPKHWKRNTAIAMFGIFLVCIPIAMKSAELENWSMTHTVGPKWSHMPGHLILLPLIIQALARMATWICALSSRVDASDSVE